MLSGCEMCNTGIVEEVKSLQKGGLSVKAATEVMEETADYEYPELRGDFSANKIRARYNRQMKSCTKSTAQTNTNNNSELEEKSGDENKESEKPCGIESKIFKRVNQLVAAKRAGKVESFKIVSLEMDIPWKTIERKYYQEKKKVDKELKMDLTKVVKREDAFWNKFAIKLENLCDEVTGQSFPLQIAEETEGRLDAAWKTLKTYLTEIE